jgi:hypothetical protein
MTLGYSPQIDVENIISAIIVFDLSSCPIYTFNVYGFSRFNFGECRDIWVPAIMEMRLGICWLVQVNFDCGSNGRHDELRVDDGEEGRGDIEEWTIGSDF